MLWGVVLGDNEGGRKESDRLEKLPVSECRSHVGLLGLSIQADKEYLPNGYFVEVIIINVILMSYYSYLISSLQSYRRMIVSYEPSMI